jgi:hypothetical protein
VVILFWPGIFWLLGTSEITGYEKNVRNNNSDPFFGVPWPMRLPNAAPLDKSASTDQAYITSMYWYVGEAVARAHITARRHGTMPPKANICTAQRACVVASCERSLRALTMLMKTPMVGPDTVNEKIFASFTIAIGAILFAVELTFVATAHTVHAL